MNNFFNFIITLGSSALIFLFGSHTQSNIAKALPKQTSAIVISITPIQSQTAIPTYYYNANANNQTTDNQLHDCQLNGQVLQLTYTDCHHQLDLEIAKSEQKAKYYEQKLQQMPSAEQLIQQETKDIKNYYSNLPQVPTLPPLPTYEVPTYAPLPTVPQ